MASSIVNPNRNNCYYVKGDTLALLERSATNGEWRAIDESISDGALIQYYGEPDEVLVPTDSPDVDNTLHEAFIEFLKARLYLDKAGRQDVRLEGGMRAAQIYLGLSREHRKIYDEKIRHYGRNKLDKIGGPRFVPAVSLSGG